MRTTSEHVWLGKTGGVTHLRLASVVLIGLLGIGLPATAAAQTFNPQLPSTMQPDLTASVAASSSVVGGGDQVVFTTTVSNPAVLAFNDPRTGAAVYWNSPASGISLLQSLPNGATFKSLAATGGFNCVYVAPVVSCSGGSLQARSSAAISITVSAPRTAGAFSSTVSVDPNNTISERSETNNAATAEIVVPQPDLVLSVSPSQTTVDDGGIVTFHAYVDNPAPAADTSGITLRFTMPTGASLWNAYDGEPGWFSGTVNQMGFTCATAGLVVTCNGGHLSSGGHGAVTLSMATPRINGVVSSSFVLDPANTIAERDETNNSVTLSTTINGRPDLSIEVAHSPLPLFTRTVTIHNLGVGPANNVSVDIDATKWEYYDDGPPDAFFGVIPDSGFSCTVSTMYFDTYINYHSGDAITCGGGNIPAGGTATIRIFHVLMSTDDSRSTDATVDPRNTIREVNESNNHASASTRI